MSTHYPSQTSHVRFHLICCCCCCTLLFSCKVMIFNDRFLISCSVFCIYTCLRSFFVDTLPTHTRALSLLPQEVFVSLLDFSWWDNAIFQLTLLFSCEAVIFNRGFWISCSVFCFCSCLNSYWVKFHGFLFMAWLMFGTLSVLH